MKQSTDDTANESILYELLEYFVRKQEPELIKFKNDSVLLPTPGTIKNALRYLNNRYSLPESISQQIGYTLPWKFAVGDSGRILAILQENVIEIRRSKDEYSSIIGKASIPKDAFPQWRKIAWSPDGSILVLASSNGYLSFYNSLGNNIFNISPKTISQSPDILEAGDATACMIFKTPRVQTNSWDYEFIRISYSGMLKSYCVSSTGCSENHEFSFGTFYRNGVSAVVYSDVHDLFFVAGNNVNQNMTCTASEIGLTCWRTLNDHPYYKISILSDSNFAAKQQFSLLDFIPIMRNRPQPVIFKSSISPNKQLLACLHTDGTISIWSLPTLKLQNQWKLTDQPNYNVCNPLGGMKFKKFPPNLSAFQPLDIGWWSDSAVIIARYSGAVSVCSINNLTNLLGSSPEFLYGQPLIVELSDSKGFLCLDREILVTSNKRNRESCLENHFSEASSESDREEDETKLLTLMNYTKSMVQNALYTMTDIDKFQPKRKKSKVFQKTYRLLGLKSTTPEELYNRKIEMEEYDEALALANTYSLDPDLVYQTQWRKSDFSVKAIQDHLSKISKRSWVLNECVSRVPDNLESAQELLNFGLRGANVETLVAIGINDNEKFTPTEIDDEWVNDGAAQLNQLQQINRKLENLDFNHLHEQQKELIRFRKKLLDHLDKLKTYEILLESPNKYDRVFYEEFRRLTSLENAVKFAKDSNCRGVEVMFTYYEVKLMPHWIAIISFFPETLSPQNYEKLLPECDSEDRLFLLYQQELRPKDWCERNEFIKIFSVDDDFESDFIYEQRKSLSVYRNKELNQELLGKWYRNRAYEIENDSGMVDNALMLINIGQSHNIKGLQSLLFELETLDDVVYKVGIEDASLASLEKLTNLEKIKLLMTDSNEQNFVATIRNMVLPFERRRKRYIDDNSKEDLLFDYLVSLSNEDLALPVIFFEVLKSSQDLDLLDLIQDWSKLAMGCIYACNSSEMYENAKKIFNTILANSGIVLDAPLDEIDELEREIDCLEVLNKYSVKIPIKVINKIKGEPDAVKQLFTEMCDNLNKLSPPPNERQWTLLLNDMLDIQGSIFNCVDIEVCFEICLYARLRSGVKSTILSCSSLMEAKKNEASLLKVSYNKAMELIITASNEYFNNAKSLTDHDMELAKACLELISDDNSRIKEEYELIESLQILDEFYINILPLQVRLTKDRIKLVEACLNNRDDGYKHKQKLLHLSKYLRIEPTNNRLREGKVLELITRKAFSVNDYLVCSAVMKHMMQNSYQSAWKIAMELGSCDEYNDLQFRLQCLRFAINNGPVDMLEEGMKCVNLLQVQILNKDLENMTTMEDFDVVEDNDTSFEVLPLTPQTRRKVSVPKLFETSTDLVKSSAQLVKRSTFGLIRTAGSKDFWKSKLTFGANQDKNDASQSLGIEENDHGEPKQKFCCYYETLHENCGISSLDTNYCNFSRPCYSHTDLKMFQTFLRISMLSETSCYGLEVSDINHILLDCAKHTIEEDCLLGLGYLFSLQDEYALDEQNIYESLPKSRITALLQAYFYSLKLFKRIYPGSEDIYSYDPNKMISTMSATTLANDEDKIKIQNQINILLRKAEKSEEDEVIQDVKNEVPENNAENIEPIKYSESLYSDNAAVVPDLDEWTSWGDEDWSDVQELIDRIPDDKTDLAKPSEESFLTEEERYMIFEDLFSTIQDKDDYNKVKKLLIDWNKFDDVNFTGIDRHPSLKMIMKLLELTDKNNSNEEELTLKEMKEILNSQPVFKDILVEFIDRMADVFTVEQAIYLRLCSKAPSLMNEAVDIIKDKYKILRLSSAILEELFFNNLTGLFSPSHELYNRILEEVFVNRTIHEIEDNVKVLIDQLVQQRNISHAIALLNQLEGIPQSLSTYDNCFQLLLRK